MAAPIPKDSDASRALVIIGPTAFVRPDFLYRYFKSKILHFDTEEITILQDDRETGQMTVEWRFARWDYQAQTGYLSLRQEMAQGVTVYYGVDPCSLPPPEDFVA